MHKYFQVAPVLCTLQNIYAMQNQWRNENVNRHTSRTIVASEISVVET